MDRERERAEKIDCVDGDLFLICANCKVKFPLLLLLCFGIENMGGFLAMDNLFGIGEVE